MRIRLPTFKPLLVLLLLSPAIAEFLTGSTPITGLVLNPLTFVFQLLLLLGLYGAGVVLIRELSVIWQKGWASILLLGAAYGILEEGIAVHTFFQPSGSPVGVFGSYGRLFGVNWVWAVGLTIFHAVFSIALPILLVRLLYPQYNDQRWLDRGALRVDAVVYMFTVVLLWAAVPSRPTPPILGLFLLIIAAFVLAAYRCPRGLLSASPGPPRGTPWTFVAAGAVLFPAWLSMDAIAGTNALPPILAVVAFLTVLGLDVSFVLSRIGDVNNDWAKLSLVAGFLLTLFVWDVLLEFILVPGILVVDAIFIVFLFRTRRIIRLRESGSVLPLALASY